MITCMKQFILEAIYIYITSYVFFLLSFVREKIRGEGEGEGRGVNDKNGLERRKKSFFTIICFGDGHKLNSINGESQSLDETKKGPLKILCRHRKCK